MTLGKPMKTCVTEKMHGKYKVLSRPSSIRKMLPARLSIWNIFFKKDFIYNL